MNDRNMYHVQQRDFGYILTLTGVVQASDLKGWYEASHDHLQGRTGPFGVLVDAQRCRPLSKVARFWMLRGQQACEDAGLARAAVLVDSRAQDRYWPGLITTRYRDRRVRFIDAADRYPRVRALSWILKQVDPSVQEGHAGVHTTRNAPALTDAARVDPSPLQ